MNSTGLSCAPHFGDCGFQGSQPSPHLAPTGLILPCHSPDAAPHKAALSASSSSSPPVWPLSLPGAHPVSLRSTRTLLLYLSLERGGQAPLLSHCSLRGPPGCALVTGTGTGSPPRWPWHPLGTCHAAATGTSWDGTGGPFPSGTARLHQLLSLPQGRAVSLGVHPGGEPPQIPHHEPCGRGGEAPVVCSLVQNQQWPPNRSQRDVLSTMQPLSLAPERGTCPTQPFPALFPLPATLAKPGVLWLSIGAKTPSPCQARPLSPCAQ